MPPIIYIVEGDLLDQNVEVIVNAWNRNIIPWWLLLPQGVSGAIKRRGGYEPFRELAKYGPIPFAPTAFRTAGQKSSKSSRKPLSNRWQSNRRKSNRKLVPCAIQKLGY